MIYDYKSDELTQEVLLECYCPLVDDLIDEYYSLRRDENISVYAPAYIAREIVFRFVDEVRKTDELYNNDCDFDLLKHDNNEVLITIGYDGLVCIETVRTDKGVIKNNEDCCLTYFYDGFGKKDLDILEENGESILVFGFEDEDELDCCDSDGDEECSDHCLDECDKNNEIAIEKDGDMHGFSVNRSGENYWNSYSFYSTDLNLVNEMAKKFK